MNGHILENTPIAVDLWHKSGNSQWIHFLSHCHMDHLVNLTSSWREPIYTSKFNVWFLKTRLMVNPKFLRELSVGDSHLIEVPKVKKTFTVTLIDANHCPGSVMFLFEGEFGTILYTGDFRYDPVMVENEALAKVIQNQMLDVLYLDNTYASPQCRFPSREDAANEILNIIRKHPNHQILIGFRNLGKESLLRKIALELNETIFVDLERLEILEYLQYEDVFTTDSRSSRIHVVPQFGLPNEHWKKRKWFRNGAVISILPTALYDCGISGCYIPYKNSEVHGIYAVPYSDHSPYSELYTFVSIVKPCKLLPIVKTRTSSRIDPSFYWDVLKTVTNIPQSIMKLCQVRRKRRLAENSAEELNYGGGDLGVQSDAKRVQHSAKRRKILTSRSLHTSRVPRAFKRKGVRYDCSESDSEDSSSRKSKEGSSVIGKCRNESVSKRSGMQCESFLLKGIHSDHTYSCEAISNISMSNATHNVSCKTSKKDDLVEISVRQPNSAVVRVRTSPEVGPMLKNVRVLLHKNFYIGYSSYENNMPTFRLRSRSKTVDRHVQTEPNLLNQIKEEGMSDDESVAAPKTVICSSEMQKKRVQDAEHISDSDTVIFSSKMHNERVQYDEHISHSMHKERVQDADHISHSETVTSSEMHNERVQDAEHISHSETVTLSSEMHNERVQDAEHISHSMHKERVQDAEHISHSMHKERVQDAEHISHSQTVTFSSEMHNEIVQNANSENNDVDNDEGISDAETVIFSPEIHYEIVDDDEPISRANSEICSSEVHSEVKCNTEIELGEGCEADHKSNIVIEGETERVFDSEVKCNTEIEIGEDFLRSSDTDHKNNIVTEGETQSILDANTVIRSSEVCNGVKCKTEIEFDEEKNVYSSEAYQENETQELCSISQESLKQENPIAYANSTTEPLITQIKVESDIMTSSTNLLDPSNPSVCENQQNLTNDGSEAVESHVRHAPSLDKTQQNHSNDGTDTPHVVESYIRHVPSVDKSQQNQSKNGTVTPHVFNPYIRHVPSVDKSQQNQSKNGTDTPHVFNPYIGLVSIDNSQQSQSVSGTRNIQSAESNIVSVPAVHNQQDQFCNRTDTSQSAGPNVRYVQSADENEQNQSKSGTNSVQTTDHMSVPFVHECHGEKTVKVEEYNFTCVDKVQQTQSRNGRSAVQADTIDDLLNKLNNGTSTIQLNDVQLSTGDTLDCNNVVTSVNTELDSDIQCSAEFSSRVGLRNKSAQHSGNVQESGVVEEHPAEMPEHQNPENSSEEIFHTCQSQTELNVLQSMAGTESENEHFFTASDETDSYSPKGNIKHQTTSVQAEKEGKKIIRREFTLQAEKLHTHSKSNKDVLENVTRCEEINDTSENHDGCLFSNNRLESPGTNKDNHKNKCHKKNSNIRCKSIHCNPRLQTDLAPGRISRKNKIIEHTEWGTNNECGKFSERDSEKNYWEDKSIDIFALINARITVGESELENNYCNRSSIDAPETRHECLSNNSPRYTEESDTCRKKNSNIKCKPVNCSLRKKTYLATDHISRKNKILSDTEQETTNEDKNPGEKDSEMHYCNRSSIDVPETHHECLSNNSPRYTEESDTCCKKNSYIKSKPVNSSLRKNADLAPDHISRTNKILSDTERETTNEDQNSGEKDSEIGAVIDVPETHHECLSNASPRYTEESDTCCKKNSNIKSKPVNSSLRKKTDLATDHISRKNIILSETEREATNEDQNPSENDSEIGAVIDVSEILHECLSNDGRLDSPRYAKESDTCHKKNSNIKSRPVNSSLRKKTDLAPDHISRRNKILSDTERESTNEDQNSGEKDSEMYYCNRSSIDIPVCINTDTSELSEKESEDDCCSISSTIVEISELMEKYDITDNENESENNDYSNIDIAYSANLSKKESEEDCYSSSSSIAEISQLMEKYNEVITDSENESEKNYCTSGSEKNYYSSGSEKNCCTYGLEKNCCTSGSEKNYCTSGMEKNCCTSGSEKNYCTSGLEKNCCTSGSEKNCCISGTEKNYCSSGLEKNCCTSGLEKNCCTSGLEKNCCTSGSKKNCSTSGSEKNYCTSGSEKNFCSDSSKTHYECFSTDSSKKESAATNRDDHASHRWYKKNSNKVKHKSVCCSARKQANNFLRKNTIIRDIERGTSSEHEREPEKNCSKGIVKNSEKVSGKNYWHSSSLDVTSLIDTCISDSEELSERDCERNFWDAGSIDVSALADAVVAGEKLFLSLHHRKTNEQV